MLSTCCCLFMKSDELSKFMNMYCGADTLNRWIITNSLWLKTMSQLLVPAPVLALQAVREKRSVDWRDNGAVWISRVSASSEQPHRSQVTNGGIPLYSSSLSPRCVLHVFPTPAAYLLSSVYSGDKTMCKLSSFSQPWLPLLWQKSDKRQCEALIFRTKNLIRCLIFIQWLNAVFSTAAVQAESCDTMTHSAWWWGATWSCRCYIVPGAELLWPDVVTSVVRRYFV